MYYIFILFNLKKTLYYPEKLPEGAQTPTEIVHE